MWAQSMIKVQTLPTPEDWGWKFENYKLIPHWTDLAEAVVAVIDLIKCACTPVAALYRTLCLQGKM